MDGVEACAECLRWPEGLGSVRAPFLMEGGAARLVHALKYRGWTALGDRMGRAMAESARDVAGDRRAGGGLPPVLVPVPLSAARRRRRGFNQAGVLAEALAGELGWPCRAALERTSRGRPQSGLGASSRRENAAGRFRAAPPREAAGRSGGRGRPAAVVVDDVVTTGSTAAACAGALRRAEWRVAGAVAFARAISVRADGPAREGRRRVGPGPGERRR